MPGLLVGRRSSRIALRQNSTSDAGSTGPERAPVSAWAKVAPKARRLSLRLGTGHNSPTSSHMPTSTSSPMNLDAPSHRDRSTLNTGYAMPTENDVLDLLYPPGSPHNSPDLRHRGDFSTRRRPVTSSSNHRQSVVSETSFSATQHHASGAPPYGPHPRNFRTAPVSEPERQGGMTTTSMNAQTEPHTRRTQARYGCWDNLMDVAARRSAQTTPQRLPRESVARADLPPLDLADVPIMGVSGSPHAQRPTRRRRTRHVNRDPTVTGGPDAPPAYSSFEKPPEYSTQETSTTAWVQADGGIAETLASHGSEM